MSNSTSWTEVIEQIGRVAPESAAGYARIRAVIDSDGAIRAAHKALMVAVGAAVKHDVDLARRELVRGRAAGLTDAEIATGATALLISRGESACARLLHAAGPLADDEPPRPSAEVSGVDYFLAYNGSDALPPRLALLADRSPEVFEGYFRMHHAALTADPESAKLAELVLCSLNAAELEGPFVGIHAVTARRAGASDEELIEAIVCAIPVAGVACWAAASGALFPDV
jgi:alkylhydroperoxidase/carboxymuconolactone decarboxylase family protein YurZ